MSNRTLIELNHDYCPHGHDEIVKWGNAMTTYMRSGDKRQLPPGVEFVEIRHHADDSVITQLYKALKDEICPVAALAGTCQKGVMERCRCEKCRNVRSRAAIAKVEVE